MPTALTEPTANWTDADRRLMGRALELASKGVGLVSPGPLVGCVIVDCQGLTVGEGFYVFEELKHAETIALAQAGDRARGGTAYVSLEPHAHHGRTPPCTDALIAAGIERVVAPIEDLNPKVSGKGYEHLRKAGIEVQTGLMAAEATQLNEAYLHYMRSGRPFVHLKLATSLDGKIATWTGNSRWITGQESRARAHELRHQYDAILVGVGTANADDPLLTDRSEKNRRQPLLRIVLDDKGELAPGSQLVQTARESPVMVVVKSGIAEEQIRKLQAFGIEILKNDNRDLLALLNELGKRSVQSVLVEGGATVAGNFVDQGLVHKVTFFIAPKIVGGKTAPTVISGNGVELMCDAHTLKDVRVTRRGTDIEVTGYLPVKV